MNLADRKAWLGYLAKAPAARLIALWQGLGLDPEYRLLRGPETGTVMVRGRIAGTGDPFNLGEMTVTRCALELEEGAVGHGYVQGRSHGAARSAALVDALMQTGAAERVRAGVLEHLAEEAERARKTQAARAAATKVEFFTLVRGEDA